MNDSAALQQLADCPALAGITPALRGKVLAHDVQWLTLPAGAVLFDEGSPCPGFPMLVNGEVRVARGSREGRALELYRVQRGELCASSRPAGLLARVRCRTTA